MWQPHPSQFSTPSRDGHPRPGDICGVPNREPGTTRSATQQGCSVGARALSRTARMTSPPRTLAPQRPWATLVQQASTRCVAGSMCCAGSLPTRTLSRSWLSRRQVLVPYSRPRARPVAPMLTLLISLSTLSTSRRASAGECRQGGDHSTEVGKVGVRVAAASPTLVCPPTTLTTCQPAWHLICQAT